MNYEITFTSRGAVTDGQKEDLLKRLKLSMVREKGKGTWIVKGHHGVTTEDLRKALHKFKISQEMSNAEIKAL